MDLVRGMRLFVRVTELGSFRKAATEFDLSAPMVTRSMEMLESHLGVKLLNRTTRSIQVTACGRRYLESCRSWLENLDELESTIPASDGEPKGTLHVTSSTAEKPPHLSTLICDFRNVYPNVDVELVCIDDAALVIRRQVLGNCDTTSPRVVRPRRSSCNDLKGSCPLTFADWLGASRPLSVVCQDAANHRQSPASTPVPAGQSPQFLSFGIAT
jgi:molybdenum-dependent DNA-binding transcriptional regulator ModE